MTITSAGIQGITVQEEGTNVLTTANTINFVGSGVTASNVGNVATITISSAGGGSNIANGTSNVDVAASGGNVTTSVNGNANILVVTGTGANINGYANITGNLSAGNLSVGNISSNLIPSANITYDIGNATYRWKDLYLSESTIYLGTTATLSAGIMTNGNSNVGIPVANGNINMSVAGNTNVVIVTGTGANIRGYANVTGNFTTSGANISLGSISNLHISGGTNGYVLQTDGAGNLSWTAQAGGGGNGVPGGANTQVQFNNDGNFAGNSGFIFDSTVGQLSVPGNVVVGNATGGNLTGANVVFSNSFVSNGGNVDFATNNPNVKLGNVANVHIGGGVANYVLTTDGDGNLSWAIGGSGGGVAGTNTQVQFNDAGVMGANANLTFNKTNGNLTVGSNVVAVNFIGSGANTPTIQSGTNLDIIANAGVRVPSNISMTGANVSLGAVANVHITGGTGGQVLRTDGVGNLSWVDPAGNGGNGTPAGVDTQLQYNQAGAFGANVNLEYDYANSNLWVGNRDNAWIDPVVGTARGNLFVRGALTVGSSQFGSGTDTEAVIRMLDTTSAYGFTTLSSGILAITNEEASFNQAIILGDSCKGNSETIFGVSTYPGGNGTLSTGQPPEVWSPVLDLRGDNLFISVISQATTANALFFNPTTGRVSYGTAGGIAIQDEGANVVASANRINFVGNGVVASNVGGIATITIPGNDGNGNPGGANTQVQYNDDGIFGGNPAFTFDEGNTLITANNFVATSTANLGDVGNVTILGGNANLVLTTDGNGVLSWSNGSAIANVAAGGANTQVQYNDDGILGGNPAFTFDEGTTLITANNLTVTSITNLGIVGNVHIDGGNNGYYLQTDGAGNLTWGPGSNSTGNGSVSGANTQVQFNDEGNFGAVAGFTFNKTSTTLTANNIVASSTANLGAVGNVTILGGTANFVLTTDGTGNLSWGNGGLANVAGSNTQIQFNDGGVFGANAGFTFDKTDGWLRSPGNITALSEIHFGYEAGSNAINDAWGRMQMFTANGANQGYGFTYQAGVSAGGNNQLVITNEESTFNQAFVMADGLRGAPGTAFGFSILDKSGPPPNSTPTTGSEAGWMSLLEVDYYGNFNLPGTTNLSNVPIVDSGTANVGGLISRGKSYLNDVSNVTIEGGTNGYFLQTDGTGNLTWSPASGNSNANSSVAGANTQIQFNDEGNFGAAAGFTFNKTTTTLTANNIVGTSTVNFLTASNVSLGAVANVHINGGNANFVLTTDGSGNLSWANLASSNIGNIRAAGSNTQVQYNDDGVLGGNPAFTFDEGTSLITANNLTVSSITNLGAVSNVHIDGGNNGYYLQTDGTGNLTWAPGANSSGNAEVAGANTQIQFNDEGNFGAAAGFTFNKTTTTLTANNITGTGTVNFLTTSNVSLGAVANVHINGGNANFVLTTDGSGNLSWANLASSNIGNIRAAGSNTQVQYNDDGVLGGNPAFTFDEGTSLITANNLTVSSITNLGAVSNVHIDGGNNGYYLQTDGTGNLTWAPGANSSGNAEVAGANTQIQFNDEGNFGAVAGFTFDKTTTIFTANNIVATSTANLGNVGNVTILGGNANFVLTTDGAGILNWSNLSTLSNIKAGGANTQVQYNDNGILGGNPTFTFDEALSLITANNFAATSTANLGDVANIWIGGGNANFVLTTDGSGALSWANLANGGAGNIKAAGANTQIQYNDNGVLGGHPGLVFDEGLSLITANNLNVSSITNLGDIGNVHITGGNPLDVIATIDGTGNLGWATITFDAGGTNTQVQYNDNGVLGGNPTFTFDEVLSLLTINNFAVTSTANLGAVGNITILGGNANYVLTTDGSGVLSWTAGSGGNGTPGGTNTQIQYNNNGVFGGNGYFTYDQSTRLLSLVGNAYIAQNLNVGGVSNLNSVSNVIITGGTNGYVLTTDGAGALSWTTKTGPAGNGIAGGADTQVQYNDAGDFGGNPTFTFNEGTTTLTANNFVVTSTANLGDVGNVTITGGTSGQYLTTDGAGTLSWAVGDSGMPGGSNTQMQFNDGGSFGGSPTVTYADVFGGRYLTISGNATSDAAIVYEFSDPANVAVTGVASSEGNIFVSGYAGAGRSKIAIEPGVNGNIIMSLGSTGGIIQMGQVDTIEILGGTNGQVLATAGDGNLYWTSGGGGGNISVYQGLDFIVNSSDLYFNGPLVSVTDVFDTPQVEIGLTVKDEGTTVGLEKCFGTINFAGTGVTVTRPGDGNVALVTIPGGGGSGVSAPYIRTYTGNLTTQCINNDYWWPIPLDNDAIVNDIGAYDYINGVTSLQPGTYYFESTVYLNCTGGETIQGAYVCLIANPSISLDPILGTSSPAPTGTVLAKAGVVKVANYSTTPVMGIGTFTIVTETKVSLAFSQYSASPDSWCVGDQYNLGYNTTILKLWKTA